MASTGRYGPPATAEEICSAIQDLTDLEWSRIEKFAGEHLWGTDFQSPDALINETFSRFLAGGRSWPAGVGFLPCLCNAMKSVANGERELIRHDYETAASELASPDVESDNSSDDSITSDESKADSAESCVLREERRQTAAADLERIEDFFKNDDEVKWVFMGIEDGLSAAEVQSISLRRRMKARELDLGEDVHGSSEQGVCHEEIERRQDNPSYERLVRGDGR